MPIMKGDWKNGVMAERLGITTWLMKEEDVPLCKMGGSDVNNNNEVRFFFFLQI